MGEGYDLESGVLKQAIKHAPGKRTVGAAALQGKGDFVPLQSGPSSLFAIIH